MEKFIFDDDPQTLYMSLTDRIKYRKIDMEEQGVNTTPQEWTFDED